MFQQIVRGVVMNEKQILELIGGLNKEGLEAFNSFITYLYFSSILEAVAAILIFGGMILGFYKLIKASL
jgi:hypothetical protein